MDAAAAAIEKVPLLSGEAVESSGAIEPSDSSDTSRRGSSSVSERPSWFAQFLERIHAKFDGFCHALCSYFLRALSSVMLIAGVVAAVILQIVAFYYTGVLNVYVLIACVLYAPSLAAVSILREETLSTGTSRSGAAPFRTRLVTLAYLLLTVSAFASLCQPLIMGGDGQISVKSMWTSIAATLFFYYCILISEVLFAAAVNVRLNQEFDEERRRAEMEDPLWFQQYQSMLSKRKKGAASKV